MDAPTRESPKIQAAPGLWVMCGYEVVPIDGMGIQFLGAFDGPLLEIKARGGGKDTLLMSREYAAGLAAAITLALAAPEHQLDDARRDEIADLGFMTVPR